ncbi:MAG TPA: PE-PPE domain-containing protein [Candidatus Limnocylindrales bacterium]|nr:PE-PPE domain-containing protein [Candidatus Limnocylindrales bacterium]
MSPADGDLQWPEVSHDGVTEIYVHGVGGAAPANMLDSLEVRQVTGDHISGMWRPLADTPGSGATAHREAYSWGGLTRRPLAAALWLLLLPFALANVAGWMATGRRSWAVRYQQSLVRVFSLLCTWTYVLFAAQMAMDLGAWQCVRLNTCRIDGWWPDGYTPAQAAAVASLVPGLLVFALWLTTHRSRGRYEDFFPDRGSVPPGEIDIAEIGLDDKRLWSGKASSDHRMWLHLSSSILVIAILLATIAGSGLLLMITGGLLTLAVILAGADRFAPAILKGLKGKLALLLAVGVGVWSAVAAFHAPEDATDAIMPGMLDAFNGVMVADYGAVMLLFVAVWASGGWKARATRGLLRAMPAQVVVLTLGTWLMFAVLSGTVITVARVLNASVGPVGDPRSGVLLYPTPYIPLARISIAGLLVVGLCALVHYLWQAWSPSARKRFHLDREKAFWNTQQIEGGLEPIDRKSWERRARAAVRRAEVIAWAETGIAVLTILAVVASITYSIVFGLQWLGGETVLRAIAVIVVAGLGFTSAAVIADRRGPLSLLAILAIVAGVAAAAFIAMPALPLPALKPTPSEVDLSYLPVGVVTLALTFVPAAVMLVLRKALRDRKTLGHIAVAWDIVTFWPRSFHPMAPPSYAERAVPELTLRITHIVSEGQSVLVMGHSQGSVVAAAAVAQLRGLTPEQRQRISVITYGSPLQSLYHRWFPCYINRNLLREVRDGLHWANFFRRTDPIGHESIFGDSYLVAEVPAPPGGDVMLPDPASDRHRPGDPDLNVRGHSGDGYVRQSAFRRYHEAELERLTALTSPTRSELSSLA